VNAVGVPKLSRWEQRKGHLERVDKPSGGDWTALVAASLRTACIQTRFIHASLPESNREAYGIFPLDGFPRFGKPPTNSDQDKKESQRSREKAWLPNESFGLHADRADS
jgi:hypothetical protein